MTCYKKAYFLLSKSEAIFWHIVLKMSLQQQYAIISAKKVAVAMYIVFDIQERSLIKPAKIKSD